MDETVSLIGKTTYKPGDIWVFRVTQNVSRETVEAYAVSLKASIEKLFPGQTPPQFMLITPGIEFSILSQETG